MSLSRMTRKRALPLHLVAGKEPAGVADDHLFQRDEARRAGFGEIRQADEAIDLLRQADQRVQDLRRRFGARASARSRAEVGDERKRMRRVDGQRRQHGKDVVRK